MSLVHCFGLSGVLTSSVQEHGGIMSSQRVFKVAAQVLDGLSIEKLDAVSSLSLASLVDSITLRDVFLGMTLHLAAACLLVRKG